MIVPVILCGGSGTRLWPASREDAPKPFLPIVDGATTFAMTLVRIADRTRYTAPLVVTSAGHRHLVDGSLAAAGVTGTVLLEPDRRDTAAAVASAAAYAAAADPEAVILVLAADHVIRDHLAFAGAVASALPAALGGAIVVFGLRPTYPATGFGYIHPGAPLGAGAARAVVAFVEKPDRARAEEFIAAGYLWNSGIFLMKAATALAEMEKHAPGVAAAARAAVAAAKTEGGAVVLDRAAFAAAPKLSLDYAVMEKTDRAAVVEAGFDWSDVGTWAAVWDAAAKDADGNVTSGDAFIIDAKNAYVSTDRYTVGVAGVDDVVVVAADGQVLVTTRQRSGAVKELVAAIGAGPEKLFGDFVRHFRPWGYYQSLDQGAKHQVKRIVVNPGARLSLQKHAHRAEHWTVVSGVADITVGMEMETLATTRLAANGYMHIPLGAIHRMANPGSEPMTLIEVQVGDYLGEDDIVRLEDDYGRKG
ncbi:MAG: mannose-1-phosphate guanylyltransferase/mannose-6-phosphate isomerase [Bauldia sp.]